MIITIDHTSTDPLYQQIYNQIIAGIATGELEPGTSLPSVRTLASDLGINLHTVNKAYAVLRDEGYVMMRGRAGAVIAHPDDAHRQNKTEQTRHALEEELFRLALAYRASGASQKDFLSLVRTQADQVWNNADAKTQAQTPKETH